MISEKIKQFKAATSVKSAPDPELVDYSYDADSTVKNLKMRQKHHFSNKEVEDIISAYQSGATTYELAEKYNCHRRTIATQLKKLGINVTREKLDMNDAIRMYNSGFNTKQIAAKYRMSDNAVSHRLKAAGVKMRTRWDYPED